MLLLLAQVAKRDKHRVGSVVIWKSRVAEILRDPRNLRDSGTRLDVPATQLASGKKKSPVFPQIMHDFVDLVDDDDD